MTCRHIGHHLLGRVIFLLLAVVPCSLSGCGITMQLGKLPRTMDVDGALTVGVSTTEDVRNALGPPRGKGRSLFPTESRAQDVWYYYYEEGTVTLVPFRASAQHLFLFVYFCGGKYDGYLWFSTLPSATTSNFASSGSGE